MSAGGTGRLYFIEGIMDRIMYKDILSCEMLPSANTFFYFDQPELHFSTRQRLKAYFIGCEIIPGLKVGSRIGLAAISLD
jgi:hypothetical protein